MFLFIIKEKNKTCDLVSFYKKENYFSLFDSSKEKKQTDKMER